MAPLASWYRKQQLDDEADRAIIRAVREAGADALPRPNRRRAPGDPSALRGIPALVRGGFGGTMRGTDPLGELLRRERSDANRG